MAGRGYRHRFRVKQLLIVLHVSFDQALLAPCRRNVAGWPLRCRCLPKLGEKPSSLEPHEKAFGRGALGQDHLVSVEDKVDLGDIGHVRIDMDTRQVRQLDRRDQDFGYAERALGYP